MHTYWKNKASQCDFASHGYVWAHQPPAEKGGQAGRDGDSSGRPIFCDSSSWEVQVDVCILKEIKTSRSCEKGRKDFDVEKLNRFLFLWKKKIKEIKMNVWGK